MNTSLLQRIPDTEVIFGKDALSHLSGLLNSRRSVRTAVFTGRHSADSSGNFGRMASCCGSAVSGLYRFRDIPAEPDLDTVHAMTRFLEEVRPDTVIALGGGSVMDAAKAAYIGFQSGLPAETFFGSGEVSKRFPGKKWDRVICIPTTAGTGSEVTLYSNIVDRNKGVKKLLSDEAVIPEFALVDPVLTESLPPAETLATACDALSHLLEGFLNAGQDNRFPPAEEFAVEGVKLICGALPRYQEARADLAMASTLGGAVIRWKSTGLPHLASFSWFGRIPHGIAAALLLPAAWRYYLGNPAVADKTMQLASVFPGATPEEVIRSFRKFLDSAGVPAGLKAYPLITEEILAKTAQSAGENPMKLALAPRPVPLERAPEILAGILAETR